MAMMNLNLFSLSAENAAFLQFIVSELALRGSTIALFSILLILLLAKNNASERSLLWLMLIIALALMPGFALWIPEMSVALTVAQHSTDQNSMSWYGSMASFISSGSASAWSPTLQTLLFATYSFVACSALARGIEATARLNNVPVLKDFALSEELAAIPLGNEIPEELIFSIATVFEYLLSMDDDPAEDPDSP